MTDLAAEPAEQLSTTLDTTTEAGPSGGGAPRTLAEPDEPKAPSLRDTIAEEVKKDTAADDSSDKPTEENGETKDKKAEKAAEKPQDAKPTPDAKEPAKSPERGPDGKFAAKEAASEEQTGDKASDQANDQPKSSGHIEAPKSFLPDAKETWRNTPRAVQRDVENMARQHESELAQHKEAAERYETIRAYDEAARKSGRAGVHESLAEVVQLENLMQANPMAALNQILMRAGPRKADGQPISLFELAQAIINTGQDGYQRAIAQQPQQTNQRQPDPEVAALKQQLAEMREQQMAAQIIGPFKAEHPRYDELESDIAFFLQSGKIPASLSPSDRLAAAYDMAARINPASHANDAPDETDLEPARRAAETSAPAKSIKSAPGAVTSEMEPERGGSIRDLLAQEMKRAKGSR